MSLLSDSFNQPPTDDTTSAPPMPAVPSPSNIPVGPGAQNTKQPKQAKIKKTGELASAISRAKRAHQGSRKFG